MPPNQPRAEPRLNPAGSRQSGGTHCSSAVSPRPSPPLGVPLSVTSARPTTRTPDGCRAAPRHPGVPPKLLVPARRAAASSRDRSHFPGELPVGNSPVIPGSGIDSRGERGAREGPPNAVKPAPSPAPALPGAAAQRRFTGHPTPRGYLWRNGSRGFTGCRGFTGSRGTTLSPGNHFPDGIISPPGHHLQRVHRPPPRCAVSRSITPVAASHTALPGAPDPLHRTYRRCTAPLNPPRGIPPSRCTARPGAVGGGWWGRVTPLRYIRGYVRARGHALIPPPPPPVPHPAHSHAAAAQRPARSPRRRCPGEPRGPGPSAHCLPRAAPGGKGEGRDGEGGQPAAAAGAPMTGLFTPARRVPPWRGSGRGLPPR